MTKFIYLVYPDVIGRFNKSKMTYCKLDQILDSKQYFWSYVFLLFWFYGHFYLFIRSSGFLVVRSSGFGLLDQLGLKYQNKY